MILKAYSIFDSKALIYNPPFFQATDGLATRMFMDLANDANTSIGRHPSDYILYCVGTYDDGTGRLDAISPVSHVVDAIALVRQQPPLFPKVTMDPEQFQSALNGEAL